MEHYRIGESVRREEDPRLLNGAGRYVSDIAPLGQAFAHVLRSPHAHAAIRGVDTSRAMHAPGVLLVLTGEDPPVRDLGLLSPRMPRKRRDGSPAFVCSQPHLARGRVRYVGDPVALVVAESLLQARDAAELIEVDYEPMPAVTGTADAVAPGAPPVWDACPDNQAFFHEVGNRAAVDAAFGNAAHVVRHKLVINRLAPSSMEPRGCLAEYDASEERYIIHCTVQAPHRIRALLANQVLRIPETRLRVISENMGGGFGMKGGCYPEYTLTLVAARLLGRPVKWIGDRSESLLADEHGRDNVTEAELALDREGRFLALRSRTLANCGAYYTSDRNAGPAVQNLGVLAGVYTTPVLHAEVTGVLSHTMMVGYYRGAGRPEAAYVIEALVDKAARELGLDPAELRRRNTIPADAMPFKTGLVYTYDTGNFLKNMEDCLKAADYAGFAKRRQDARSRGKLRGIGVSNTIEASAFGMIEAAEVRFDPSGTVTLLVGTHDHGQGHATTYKQILCETLGISADRIRFKCGDSDLVVIGSGTMGSRSAAMGGSAVHAAAQKIIAKAKKIASHLLEAAEDDLLFEAGKFNVSGTDKSVHIVEVAKSAFTPARLPRGFEPGLYETATFNDGGRPTFPNGCHVCELEIDATTGVVELVRYSVVDDVGRAINPLLVKGQIHGGIVQGAGQALMEDFVADPDSGQVLTGSFTDYCMPRADDFCSFDVEGNEFPSTVNPLGIKGAGESGTVGALAAVMSAVNDALAQAGCDYLQMPATPDRIWHAVRAARERS
ncbi:MAG: hypothetical protein A3H32_05980 [Betaproteobacteria bacterium RIFCSPLOWO2_02_FULL_63_19]|nr:MAG: hypothetical protein A3H32_05980 [Betaproteobacteria bacterium RIFCSPLOWO2_02_FULL_63_19]